MSRALDIRFLVDWKHWRFGRVKGLFSDGFSFGPFDIWWLRKYD